MAPKYAKFHGESDGKGPEARNGPKQAKKQKFGFKFSPRRGGALTRAAVSASQTHTFGSDGN